MDDHAQVFGPRLGRGEVRLRMPDLDLVDTEERDKSREADLARGTEVSALKEAGHGVRWRMAAAGVPGEAVPDVARHGGPIYGSKLSHMPFEPSGLTNDADIRSQVDRRLQLPLGRQEVPDDRPAGGGRHPLTRGAGEAGRGLQRRGGHGSRGAVGRAGPEGPDRPLQQLRRRSRVLEVRRQDDPRRHLLHVQGLRD